MPMYFFLRNLSLVDFCFISSTVPKMLVNTQMWTQSISCGGCLMQIYFCILLANTDNFLLTAMAYDRFVTICHPLHYSSVMTLQICTLMLGSSWLISNFHSQLHTLLMACLAGVLCQQQLPLLLFLTLLQLSCSNTQLNELMILLVGGLIILIPFPGILVSYIYIVSAVLKVPSTWGKQKVFSTCGSYFTVAIIFYGTIPGAYMNLSSSHSAEKDSLASVMYIVVTPILNSFNYYLRSKDMKGALRKLFSVKALSCGL